MLTLASEKCISQSDPPATCTSDAVVLSVDDIPVIAVRFGALCFYLPYLPLILVLKVKVMRSSHDTCQ